MLRNSRFYIIVGSVVLVTVLMVLAGCGSPHPNAEPRICATQTDEGFIRVPDEDCYERLDDVMWLQGNDTLGYDDYTPVGALVDDDYLGPDTPDKPKVTIPRILPTTKAAVPTKKAAPTTKKTRPTTR